MPTEVKIQSIRFPNPEVLVAQDLVYVGGTLSVDNLLAAYRLGIFPWPQPKLPVLWYSPCPRGILKFSKLKIPRSLRQFMKKSCYRITFNHRFSEVIDACSKVPRSGQDGTWILDNLKPAYNELFKQGYAHSVECWDNDKLVGGLYGVLVDGIFSGESMFHKASYASKLCLVELVAHLRQAGLTWMDTQMLTPVIQQMGGEWISKPDYYMLLRSSQALHQSAKDQKIEFPRE